jgi:hypothetical protein
MFVGSFSGSFSVTDGTSFGGDGMIAFVPLSSSFTSGAQAVTYYLQQPVNPPAPPGGYLLSIGNSASLTAAVDFQDDTPPPTDVPEPRSMILMSAGLFAIGLLGRKRLAA